jgi:hypothetical protein
MQPASPDVLNRRGHAVETELHLSGEKINQGWPIAAVWDMDHVDAGQGRETGGFAGATAD